MATWKDDILCTDVLAVFILGLLREGEHPPKISGSSLKVLSDLVTNTPHQFDDFSLFLPKTLSDSISEQIICKIFISQLQYSAFMTVVKAFFYYFALKLLDNST